jgi:diguanylate cyclase (GGDEF)-like protein
MFGAAFACLLRAALRRTERPAWTAIGFSLVAWSIGDALWDFHLGALEEPPFPNVADAFYLLSYLGSYAGYLLLLRARVRPWPLSLWLDGLIGGLALAGVAAALVFPAVLAATEGDATTVLVTLSYPVADLLLVCVVVLAFALTNWRPGRAWTLLLCGTLVQVVGDSFYQYRESLGTFESGTLISSSWPLAALLVSLAAWQPRPRRADADGATATALLPVGFAVIALSLLLYAQLAEITDLAGVLAVAALAVALARGGLAFAENARMIRRSRQEAITDALSGLSNRRKLMEDLRDTFEDERQVTLAFFDLDGFKQYNDSFGHGAGDALLARLGGRLRDAVGAAGAVYRLGGDEFCVLLDGDPARVALLLEVAAEALNESGDGFQVGASCGLVGIPMDAASPEQALQIADERMYADKDRRRASGRRQVRDVLAQTLREREPTLDEHHRHVAEHAAATARALGCIAEEVDEVARAAEMHDIGKVAIPDEILHKPAALSEDEWTLMRQHTVIGERILAAAPALRPVARLVRSSHERWDGGGYPDALAGEGIPLGARIVSVCDAYDAMRTPRPYAAARSDEEARAELARCAGRQFDPRVVAAFLAVLDAPPALPAPAPAAVAAG